MNTLAIALQQYFTTYAHAQRDLSPNNVAAYRDTWRMLIKHLTDVLGVAADEIDFDALNAELITGFLTTSSRCVATAPRPATRG